MAMVDMNIKSERECYPSDCGSGLTLYLSPEQCEALGIKTAPEAGSQIMLRAKATIKSVTTEACEDGDKDQRLFLEINQMEIGSFSDGSSEAANSLYG